MFRSTTVTCWKFTKTLEYNIWKKDWRIRISFFAVSNILLKYKLMLYKSLMKKTQAFSQFTNLSGNSSGEKAEKFSLVEKVVSSKSPLYLN